MSSSGIALRLVDHEPDLQGAYVLAEDDVRLRRACSALAAGGLAVLGSADLGDPSAADGYAGAIVMACDVAYPEHTVALRRLHKAAPDSVVVALSPMVDAGAVRRALSSGAHAVVLDEDAETVLASAVRAAIGGYLMLPRELHRCVARPVFSHREKQVLSMVVRGFRNGEIAQRLFLAESTVKSHLSTSFEKLGVSSRREAAAVVVDPAEGLAEDVLAVDLHDPMLPGESSDRRARGA